MKNALLVATEGFLLVEDSDSNSFFWRRTQTQTASSGGRLRLKQFLLEEDWGIRFSSVFFLSKRCLLGLRFVNLHSQKKNEVLASGLAPLKRVLVNHTEELTI